MSGTALVTAAPAAALPVALPPLAKPALFGVELFEAAMRGEVALSDEMGCWELLRHSHPRFGLEVFGAARRVAIDLALHVARRPDAGLVKSCLAAVAMIEDVAGGNLEAEPHAVLAQVADLLDGALALVAKD